MSGGGKSITLELIKENIIHLNADEDFDILSFDLEMPAQDQALRLISNKLSISREQLLSLETPLEDKLLETVLKSSESIKNRPVYVVETPGTSTEIHSTIMDFVITRQLADRKRGLIVTIDHTLLTKGQAGEGEKEIIDNLCKMFVHLKKECINMKVKIIIIMLSQLNRDIESKERVLNSKLHYPSKNDLFAASSVYYSSDYVLVTHKPSLISGIDHFYGPPRGTQYPKGLPV
jgi:replicative DNA helicase